MKSLDKLKKIKEQFEFLEAKLASGISDNFANISREYAELKPIAETIGSYLKLLDERDELKTILLDPQLKELASEELKIIQADIQRSELSIRQILLPVDAADRRSAILEIRPGTGGDEAGLFAADLLAMYKKFSENKGWVFELIEEQISDLGGIKEATAHVKGMNGFSKLKYESGGHRGQRVPGTESGGRGPTSAATVAVLPEA